MDGRDKIKVIAVVGPTAAGKTALGVKLAAALGGEVVSCDSMQVYRGMSIASAKPTEEEMGDIKHHLIDYVNCDEPYSVARFCADATVAINDIVSRGKLPVLVGGTGLYVNSLLDSVTFADAEVDVQLREKLYKRAQQEGNEALLEELRAVDPDSAARLHVNDLKRIVRALELYHSGTTMTAQIEGSHRVEPPYEPILIGITCADRQRLYERINRRVDLMVEAGLVEEARAAFEQGLSQTAAQAIGHKELYPYFLGEKPLDECLETLKMQTRRYAKRQLSWFRRDERINWIYTDEVTDTVGAALEIIKKEGMNL